MRETNIERPVVGLTHGQPVVGWTGHTDYLSSAAAAPDWNMHQEFEVNVMLYGTRECHFEDYQFEMEPGDVRLHPSWEPHGWRPSTPEGCYLGVLFLPEFLEDEAFDGRPWFGLFAARPSERPRVANDRMRRQVLGLAHQLAYEFTMRPPGWMSAVRLDILKLLCTLQREWNPASKPATQIRLGLNDLTHIMPAVELVRANPDRRIPLSEAAEACSLSQSQFRLIFGRAMAQTFGRFALRSRLGYVAQLLVKTDWTVDAVAHAAGFTDSGHMNLHFHKVYARTASQYRLRYVSPLPMPPWEGTHTAAAPSGSRS
jgi:AraC-like DNA-binding protein